MAKEHLVDLAQLAPPTTTNTLMFLGYPVASWVLWLNLAYIVLLIAYKLYRIWKERHGSKS